MTKAMPAGLVWMNGNAKELVPVPYIHSSSNGVVSNLSLNFLDMF
jgi:hypothetical protein